MKGQSRAMRCQNGDPELAKGLMAQFPFPRVSQSQLYFLAFANRFAWQWRTEQGRGSWRQAFANLRAKLYKAISSFSIFCRLALGEGLGPVRILRQLLCGFGGGLRGLELEVERQLSQTCKLCGEYAFLMVVRFWRFSATFRQRPIRGGKK